MNYHCKCLSCGALWWCRGTYEPDTNATVLDESEIHEGQCDCDDFEITDQEPEEDYEP